MVRSVGTPYTNKGCGLKYAEVKIRFLDPDTTGTDSGRARWSWNPDVVDIIIRESRMAAISLMRHSLSSFQTRGASASDISSARYGTQLEPEYSVGPKYNSYRGKILMDRKHIS